MRTGYAIVRRLDTGSTYEGSTCYDGGAVTLDRPRLRVFSGPSYRPAITYRNAPSMTLPLRICTVEWLDAEGMA